MAIPVLVVDDDQHIHILLDRIFAAEGSRFEIVHARNPDEALALLAKASVQLAFIDLNYENCAQNGLDLLKLLRVEDAHLELIVLSSANDFSTVQAAMRAGANDYIAKGFGRGEFFHAVERALERRRWKKIEKSVNEKSQGRVGILGNSDAMRKVKGLIEKYSAADAPVLIIGETGTGKELLAERIHLNGGGVSTAFVPVNCAALPVSTVDAFFFGHEKGAFTGADRSRTGVIEEADGGTLFLDEVNSLPLELQGRLLRVLQEKRVRKLGGTKEVPVDFRLVAATNQSLEKLVKAGLFREDLFFRLNVLRVELPPLRNRVGDLQDFILAFAPGRSLQPTVLELFKRHSWPGNVRELKNVLTAMCILAGEDPILKMEHLPEHALRDFTQFADADGREDDSDRLEEFQDAQETREREFLIRAYRVAKGNVSKMARVLDQDRSHLHQKLVRLGIHNSRQRL